MKQISKIDAPDDFKELMLAVLTEEDKGNFRFKEAYERLINEYLNAKEDGQSD